jgi:hypothetical protein
VRRISRVYFYSNRTLCDVLVEMRKAVEVSNYSLVASLYSEAVKCSIRMIVGRVMRDLVTKL